MNKLWKVEKSFSYCACVFLSEIFQHGMSTSAATSNPQALALDQCKIQRCR
jgi:hypothetical protein